MSSYNAGNRFESQTFRELLSRIDDVRVHRNEFLDEVEAGSMTLHEVFERAVSDPVLAGMKVLPAIESIPGLKKVQTRRAFADVGIDEADHLNAVTAEAIAGLPAALEKHTR